MENKIKIFINKVATTLGLNTESTAVERLAQFVDDQKHTALIKRIQDIRRNSDYVPDYNKSKYHNAKQTQERPQDFGNDMEAWLKAIHVNHLTSAEDKKIREAEYQAVMTERYKNVNLLFSKFMTVN